MYLTTFFSFTLSFSFMLNLPNKKDDIVKVSYLGQDYIGIKFIHEKSANVFLQGFDSREYNLDNLDYLDNQLIVNGP